jgi:hypothetical protein
MASQKVRRETVKKNANGKRMLTDAVVNSNARNQWEKMLIAKGAVSLHFKITVLLELLSSYDTVIFKIDNIRCCVIRYRRYIDGTFFSPSTQTSFTFRLCPVSGTLH